MDEDTRHQKAATLRRGRILHPQVVQGAVVDLIAKEGAFTMRHRMSPVFFEFQEVASAKHGNKAITPKKKITSTTTQNKNAPASLLQSSCGFRVFSATAPKSPVVGSSLGPPETTAPRFRARLLKATVSNLSPLASSSKPWSVEALHRVPKGGGYQPKRRVPLDK